MHNRGLNLMKYAVTIILAMLWGSAQASGTFSVLYGQKSLDKTDWQPLQSQSEFGLGVTFKQPEWPLELVVSYLSSTDSQIDSTNFSPPAKFTGETTEVGFGARKNLTEDKAKVFIEGGLASISAKATLKNTVSGFSISDSDSAIGFWFGVGIDAMIGDSVSIGGLVRLSNADAHRNGGCVLLHGESRSHTAVDVAGH